MSIKLGHLQILWGLAGAREKFEDMVAQLIHVENPDSQRVRIVRGDGGVDSFEGEVTDAEGIDVYQIKYFPQGGVGTAQKSQIRGSFATARTSEKYKAKSWTLCLPIDLSLDETEWFEGWCKTHADTGIEIRKPWGALHLETLLLQGKNQVIRQAFFREENTELLRAQAEHMAKILAELTERGELQVALVGIKARNANRRTEDEVVVGVELKFEVTNIGTRSVPKWAMAGEYHFGGSVRDRFVSQRNFPSVSSGPGYMRLDSTILPTLSLGTEWYFGIAIRQGESLDDVLPSALRAITVKFWPVTDDGPGKNVTASIADFLEWESLRTSFQELYESALGRSVVTPRR